jgi:predicted transcriptional regulator
MKKNSLIEMVAKGMSTHDIAKAFDKSQTTVRYWLKKHELKTKPDWYYKNKSGKHCPRCNKVMSLDNFYQRRGIAGGSVYCKPCTNEQTTERTKRSKRLCIEYKGGKCEKCGYDKYDGALEFHHLDPSKKDFEISKKKAKNIDKLKPELDKCILLCSNCHRELHGGIE